MSLDWEDYEEWEDRNIRTRGGKHASKAQTESQKRAAELETQRILENRQKESEKQIEKHIEGRWGNLEEAQKTEKLKTYFRWVRDSLKNKFPIIDDGDIQKKTSLPSGPGGQHHQKNETAVVLTHLPTLISAKEENRRTQSENFSNAQVTLASRLENHLSLWPQTSPEFRSDKGIV